MSFGLDEPSRSDVKPTARREPGGAEGRLELSSLATDKAGKERLMPSKSSSSQRDRDGSQDEEAEVDQSTQQPDEVRRERAARVAEEAEDILADIDAALRASLGLDQDA